MSDKDTHTHIERTEKTGGSTGLAFIVGGLVVAVGVIAWVIYGGAEDDVDISIEGVGEAVESASESVGEAAESAAGAAENAAESAAESAESAAEAVESGTENN